MNWFANFWCSLLARANLAAKIWLSVAIFVAGFVFCTAVQQVEGLRAESRLRTVSEALVPAALRAQRAEAAFERCKKAFADAVVMQDSDGLSRAMGEGLLVVDNLRALAGIRGLPSADTLEAGRMLAETGRFLSQGSETYRFAVIDPGITTADMAKMGGLASWSASIEVALQRLKDRLTGDLQRQLGVLQTQSARQRWLNLIVLVLTLAAAAVLVNLTIRWAIMRPLLQAQADLAHEKNLLRVLLDNIPDYIYFKDAEGRFIRVNRAQSGLLGLQSEDEAVGRTDFDFLDDDCARKTYRDEREIVRTGMPLVSRIERVGSSRGARWVTSTKVPVKEPSGTVSLIVGVSRDCTDEMEAVQALRRSEESFRCLFAAIPLAVFVYDSGTLKILAVNTAAVARYGYSVEEFLGLRMPDMYPEAEARRLFATQAPGGTASPPQGLSKHLTKDRRVLEVETGAHSLDFRGRAAVVAVAHDVTERKQLERDLHQAQRLESVGQLAAGIAHEINTPIQYVGDNLRFAFDAFEGRQAVLAAYERLLEAAERGPVPPESLAAVREAIAEADLEYLRSEIPKALQQSLDGVERIATIVRAMKDFAHPGYKEKAAADLNRALQTTLLVARNEYKYVADVTTDFGELPPVVCQIAEMNQVFLNLLVNAAQAIAEVMRKTQQRGIIGVRTWRAGDRVLVAISDTGCGIPESIQDKVFDPFFTTKPVGTGSGQGLAIARSIVVEKHGGTLRFEANSPAGTTFYVSIPLEPLPPAAGGETGGAARTEENRTEENDEAHSLR